MSTNTVYSVNKWLRENLEVLAPIAFHRDEELVLPSYRVKWGVIRSLKVKPEGTVLGADFKIFCLAPKGDFKKARELANFAYAKLKKHKEGTFFVPRYVLGHEEDGPDGYIAFKDIEVRESNLPDHPEIALEVVRALAITIYNQEK